MTPFERNSLVHFKMVVKRKRSESDFSSSSSLPSSPPSSGAYFAPAHTAEPVPTPSWLSSRTRKRYRNNRPAESEVHRGCSWTVPKNCQLMKSTDHTLSLLYRAQQNQLVQPLLSHPETPQAMSVAHVPPTQKTNLHKFWSLPQKPQQLSSTVPSFYRTVTPTHCEDCSASLDGADDGEAMDVDMMTTDVDERDFGCTSCGKQVCHSCAVSILGMERKCLGCMKT